MSESGPSAATDALTDTTIVEPTMVVSAEKLHVDTVWSVQGQVRFSRRIVSETRLVEVTVRREELFSESVPAPADLPDQSYQAPVIDAPVVITLSEEIPVISMRTQVYERATVYVDRITSETAIVETVSHEVAELTTSASTE